MSNLENKPLEKMSFEEMIHWIKEPRNWDTEDDIVLHLNAITEEYSRLKRVIRFFILERFSLFQKYTVEDYEKAMQDLNELLGEFEF